MLFIFPRSTTQEDRRQRLLSSNNSRDALPLLPPTLTASGRSTTCSTRKRNAKIALSIPPLTNDYHFSTRAPIEIPPSPLPNVRARTPTGCPQGQGRGRGASGDRHPRGEATSPRPGVGGGGGDGGDARAPDGSHVCRERRRRDGGDAVPARTGAGTGGTERAGASPEGRQNGGELQELEGERERGMGWGRGALACHGFPFFFVRQGACGGGGNDNGSRVRRRSRPPLLFRDGLVAFLPMR